MDDIEDRGSVIVITIPESKTYKKRFFTIVADGSVNQIEVVRKYIALRPKTVPHKKLFLFYRNGKCSIQPVGINTIGKVPENVATYLKLPNPQLYTGEKFNV